MESRQNGWEEDTRTKIGMFWKLVRILWMRNAMISITRGLFPMTINSNGSNCGIIWAKLRNIRFGEAIIIWSTLFSPFQAWSLNFSLNYAFNLLCFKLKISLIRQFSIVETTEYILVKRATLGSTSKLELGVFLRPIFEANFSDQFV